MHLFLTTVLPFLAHNHPSAVAFLTCRYHNFHASITPEFLSDEKRVKCFCEARQKNELEVDEEAQYEKMYNLFVQTPLMQFSPSLIVSQDDCADTILKPLLKTKYFTRTLQRCSFFLEVEITIDLLHGLSKVKSLTELDLGESQARNEHLETIINSFPSLETLTIRNARQLKIVDPNTAIRISSPPPPATKTLRSLALHYIHPLFAVLFVPNFPNLRNLVLSGQNLRQEGLDLLPLSSSLPRLTNLTLQYFNLENTESLNNLVHLSSFLFQKCLMPDSLSFLTQENSLPELTTLCIDDCEGLSTSTSFASLRHAPNLHVLKLNSSKFDNECLQYLENMVHLRKLDLSYTMIVGDSRLLKTLTQNLFQLEELNLCGCLIGHRGTIAKALCSSSDSRLRVFHLRNCNLADDDLNGIGGLKNTLEVLDFSDNYKLTNISLVHCKHLMNLKILNLRFCHEIDDLSPLEDCLNLEELDVSCCDRVTDDSFKVFSEEPNSFANLRVLNLAYCPRLTENIFERLANNNNLVYRLKKLNIEGMSKILAASETAGNNICQLKGLRRLLGIRLCPYPESAVNKLKAELLQSLKNLEEKSDKSAEVIVLD